MMNLKIIFGVLCLLFSVSMCGQEEVAYSTHSLEQYAHIVTDGHYVMLADTFNRVGYGEKVDISLDYYIAKFAVTNKEWHEFITATHRHSPNYWTGGKIPVGRDRHPVVWVSYDDAMAYCDWLETLYPEYEFHLSSQGEWEYAAVGTARTCYPWGNQSETTYDGKDLLSKFNFNAVFGASVLQEPDRIATYTNKKSVRYGEQEVVGKIFTIRENGQLAGWINHRDYTGLVYTDIFRDVNDAGGYTCDVDSYPDGVSPFGCYNMSGNCWEWTSTVVRATNGAEKG